MPNYSFRCADCGMEFERWFSFHEEIRDVVCPNGHTNVERMLRPPAIIFKGSGFYVTDNRATNSASKNNGKGGKETEKVGATKSGSSSDSV